MDNVYILRHLLETIKYRISLVILEVPQNYPDFEMGNGVRTPIEILRHMTNLMRYVQSQLETKNPDKSDAQIWSEEVEIFFKELQKTDDVLKRSGIPNKPRLVETLIQGPISDTLTHVGQLAMMRRIIGTPIKSENYLKAEIIVE